MSLVLAGFAVIALGWAVQFAKMRKDARSIQPWFVILYSIGTAALAFDALRRGVNLESTLVSLALALALLVLVKLEK